MEQSFRQAHSRNDFTTPKQPLCRIKLWKESQQIIDIRSLIVKLKFVRNQNQNKFHKADCHTENVIMDELIFSDNVT